MQVHVSSAFWDHISKTNQNDKKRSSGLFGAQNLCMVACCSKTSDDEVVKIEQISKTVDKIERRLDIAIQ